MAEVTNKRKYYPPTNIRDGEGNVVSFDINNGELAEYTGAADKRFNQSHQPHGFFVIPLTSGTISVQLWGQADGLTYAFSAEEIAANIGVRLPARIKAVFAEGTTVTRMKIVW